MEPFIAQIQPFGFNFAPRGWAQCNGQLMPIAQNTALFSLIGTTFGGDGRTTFALPDLRGRSIVHIGTGPGLETITWGERAGSSSHTLSILNLPTHTHTQLIPVNNEDGASSEDPENNFLGISGSNLYNTTATSNKFLGTSVTTPTGGGQPFYSRDPFLGINVCIALVGIFPSRS